MKKTLRLNMPQWQGGNNPIYSLGANLLTWLAPENKNQITVTVPIDRTPQGQLVKENEVIAQSILLKQLKSAEKIIEEHQPDRIITFGGDCLISQAPIAYLNQRYDGKLGVLWIDAHPDISQPPMHHHEHAMVLGNLMGKGDPLFAKEVPQTISSENILYAGFREGSQEEEDVIKLEGLQRVIPDDMKKGNQKVIDWIKKNNIQHLAIHLDLDVLDPKLFHSLYFTNPKDTTVSSAAMGELTFEQVSKLLADVSKATEVVCLNIAEYMPWDVQNLKDFLDEIDIFKE